MNRCRAPRLDSQTHTLFSHVAIPRHSKQRAVRVEREVEHRDTRNRVIVGHGRVIAGDERVYRALQFTGEHRRPFVHVVVRVGGIAEHQGNELLVESAEEREEVLRSRAGGRSNLSWWWSSLTKTSRCRLSWRTSSWRSPNRSTRLAGQNPTLMLCPGQVSFIGVVTISGVNAVTGSSGFEYGQMSMKAEASEKAWLRSRGVSKGIDHGFCFTTADFTHAAWRALYGVFNI